jgi:hypothetical protein
MKRVLTLLLVCALALLLAPAALADWPHDVKWDQLDPCSLWIWQSYINDSESFVVADDFLCDETGWITDIEFNGYCSDIEALSSFRITFWRDVPATPDEASHPGGLLDEIFVVEACPCDPLGRGWRVVEQGDNSSRFRINLLVEDWFMQQADTTYWIGIQGVLPGDGGFYWNFRDMSVPTWGDDAATMGLVQPTDEWAHLGWIGLLGVMPSAYHGTLPDEFLGSADMSFRLTGTAVPEPASIGLVCLVGLLVVKYRKR